MAREVAGMPREQSRTPPYRNKTGDSRPFRLTQLAGAPDSWNTEAKYSGRPSRAKRGADWMVGEVGDKHAPHRHTNVTRQSRVGAFQTYGGEVEAHRGFRPPQNQTLCV